MAAQEMAAARKVQDKLAAGGWAVSVAQLGDRPDLVAAFMRGEMNAAAVAREIGAVPIGD